MKRDVIAIYARAWAFGIAMPLVFILPALPELAQHAVEAKLGMYASMSTFRESSASGARLGVGYVKTLALLLPGYWFVRYLAFGDARRSVRLERRAVALCVPVFLFSGAEQAAALFAPRLHQLSGITGTLPAAIADGSATLALSCLGMYLTAWGVSAALGNARITPVRSLALMAGSFWRTIGYMLAGTLPLMAIHYALGIGAIGCPGWLVAIMLALDGVVVAALAHTMAGAGFMAARAASRRKDVSLMPTKAGEAVGRPRPLAL
ncbi:MAG: hypothetical protein ACRYFW_10330 [Janthinobacterium lividum]